MYSYYAPYLIGRCEGKILLVRPFICVVPLPHSLSPALVFSPPLSCARAHTLCEVTIPFRELSEHTL